MRSLHRDAANANAVFQFASQFNCLEMAAPHVIPEGGVGIYQNDRTQGPVCSVCAGAGTIYLTLVGGGVFGNRLDWILSFIRRTLGLFAWADLGVYIVSFGSSKSEVVDFLARRNSD
ncbi:hypothetical protein [Crateriforma conspicua]|uniref:hypothetical protein n=1 Tax=Crateriforma conspicua TaxID=2527996 RepID=UPI0018CCAF66|nr:hypothetical protein [Crateriforma conspicua]